MSDSEGGGMAPSDVELHQRDDEAVEFLEQVAAAEEAAAQEMQLDPVEVLKNASPADVADAAFIIHIIEKPLFVEDAERLTILENKYEGWSLNYKTKTGLHGVNICSNKWQYTVRFEGKLHRGATHDIWPLAAHERDEVVRYTGVGKVNFPTSVLGRIAVALGLNAAAAAAAANAAAGGSEAHTRNCQNCREPVKSMDKNCRSCGHPAGNASGFIGVQEKKHGLGKPSKFQARVSGVGGGLTNHLGTFHTAEQAAHAYDQEMRSMAQAAGKEVSDKLNFPTVAKGEAAASEAYEALKAVYPDLKPVRESKKAKKFKKATKERSSSSSDSDSESSGARRKRRRKEKKHKKSKKRSKKDKGSDSSS